MFRIPYPIKVLLAFLTLVLAGSLPGRYYLLAQLDDNMVENEAYRLAARLQRTVAYLQSLPEENRVDLLRAASAASLERVTLIDASGWVLYDSEENNLALFDNHLNRAEIRVALGLPFDNDSILHLKGLHDTRIGFVRRESSTLGHEMLYAARMIGQEDHRAVLRIASDIHSLTLLSESVRRILSNSQALAISVALLLSLLAAITFSRPLQRLVASARKFAEGDFTAPINDVDNTEIGDLGRALKSLASQLRGRLANAGASEALLVQLIRIVPSPVAVIAPDRTVLACNGAAKQRFRTVGGEAEDNLYRLADSEPYREAVVRAAQHADREAVVIDLGTEYGGVVRGWVSVLHQTELAPFGVFFGEELDRVTGPMHDLVPSKLRVVPLQEVLQSAINFSQAVCSYHHVTINMTGTTEGMVVDAYDRFSVALGFLLGECAKSEPHREITLNSFVEPLLVEMKFRGAVSPTALHIVRTLIEPLGGEIQQDAGEIRLRLAKA